MAAIPKFGPLKILLGFIAAIIFLGGVILLFATPWLLHKLPTWWLAPSGPPIVVAKFLGILAFGCSYLLYSASRDPQRYVAVIDAFAFVLIVGTALDIYATFALGFATYFPASLIWGRVIVRLVIAALLIIWRPRRAQV